MVFKMKLIDTPGYGPRNEPAEWYQAIKSYIKTQVRSINIAFIINNNI